MMPRSRLVRLAIMTMLVQTTLQQSRIIGGLSARPRQFPYTVSLKENGMHFCGGVVISSTRVISAAHCFSGGSNLGNIIAEVGLLKQYEINPDIQSSAIRKIHIHPNYSNNTNDIAALELAKKLVFNEAVQSVKLPVENQTFTGNATLSGWGRYSVYPSLYPNTLQYLEMNIIDSEECNARLKELKEYHFSITDRHICTLPKNVRQSGCHGDSGGPLVQKGILIGIVQGGSPTCGQNLEVSSPNVFTRVSSYLKFIKQLVINVP